MKMLLPKYIGDVNELQRYFVRSHRDPLYIYDFELFDDDQNITNNIRCVENIFYQYVNFEERRDEDKITFTETYFTLKFVPVGELRLIIK